MAMQEMRRILEVLRPKRVRSGLFTLLPSLDFYRPTSMTAGLCPVEHFRASGYRSAPEASSNQEDRKGQACVCWL
jgi:hypothetical protein